ncbi:hypothetical protein BKP37_00675 [Anaerobacillus alkalilacustris]|uniref:Helix-turn-helix type 11 domain-containing protein n=1 Tax=Anaerobacillus alkalilacustris TaxID=393763 RepID=A0A1S2LX32_9BACI|nr:hypothetical protein [Anaerobacillus alkalilacustris]OIJ17088.1 hypothetical protein BKP37_00675 [Anaerobacillus alkalilacustris]
MLKLSPKDLEVITEVAVRTALEHLEQQKKEQEKRKYDRRLRNIKLLLRNYRSFVKHCEDVEQDIAILDEKLELDDIDTDEFAIKSIKRSKEHTLTMVKYMNKMLEVYKFMCEKSNNTEENRRYEIVYDMYVSKEKFTAKEVAERHFLHLRTVYKDIDKACETLAVLMFGVDGLQLHT